MLHSLLTEIVRRRLWPIPLIAAVVAIGAPLLFLKSAPDDAPPATTPAPFAARDSELPSRAQRLLATSDADAAGDRRGPARTSQDPFAPPPGHRSEEPGAAATKSSSTKTSKGKPVPVVVTNADDAAPKSKSTPTPQAGRDDTPSPVTVALPAVDVRFGKELDAKLRREIPRLQTFVARGDIIAVFVKYSPKRDKAVFAIAPTTFVSGDVECRRKQGVCRYVDIPAGSFARLTTRAKDGSLVTRRLDVVRVRG
jgi:hypothetical protein